MRARILRQSDNCDRRNQQRNCLMAADGGTTTRRCILAGIAATLALVYSICGSAAAEEKPAVSNDIIVTLLGTGAPEPSPTRFGPATLVQAGGLSLLFDAGRGVTVRLYQLGMSSGKGIDAVFLTHYHSDHVGGLPDLWMTGYMFGPFGSRAKPMRLWGPSDGTTAPGGVAKIAKGLAEAFSDDARIRQATNISRPPPPKLRCTTSKGTAWCSTKRASRSPHLRSITAT
jgi:ribonuclease Z